MALWARSWWSSGIAVMRSPALPESGIGQATPMQRPAQPVELAPAYVFLASQEASYVNGEVLGVHAGMPVMT